ncbi:MAG: glycosyltransferase [Cyanobacteria bacterium J06627_28]
MTTLTPSNPQSTHRSRNKPANQKIKVNVVTGQGGGGHYAAYRAIQAVAEQKELPWEFQVTDMDEIITQLSAQNEIQNAYEMFGISGHDLYNMMLKSGWTWMWPLKMRLNKFLVKLNYDVGCEFFEQHWRKQQPDIVVSVMPLYNKGLSESLQKAKPGTPYVTVMVDLADYPPAFWLEPEADCYTVCATGKAMEQARALGIEDSRLTKHSGMVIHPKFYQQPPLDIAAERQRLGLDPHKLTGIVMFGGNGSKVMIDIAKQLERYHDDLQLIFLCGRSQELAEQLQQLPGQQNRTVIGFTDKVPHYMQLSDFFIGKPGPGSLSEALAMNLPVITECGAATLIHERYNAQWVQDHQVGIVVKSFKQIQKAIVPFLTPPTFQPYQEVAVALKNQAIFELADYLQQLLAAHYPNEIAQTINARPEQPTHLEKSHAAASNQ